MNGYLLGIWRGFGIAAIFFPFTFLFPLPQNLYYWGLLILQGWLIGFYDSHLFFASARYGAGPTSRVMAVTVLITTIIWWLMTPHEFLKILQNCKIDTGKCKPNRWRAFPRFATMMPQAGKPAKKEACAKIAVIMIFVIHLKNSSHEKNILLVQSWHTGT